MKIAAKLCYRALLLIISITFGLPSCSFQKTPEEENEKEVVVTAEEKTTLIKLYSWATILPKEIIDLQVRGRIGF